MSLSAAVIDALVATGATIEQLAAAMKADLAEGEARLAEKRAKDAARQRKSRMSRDVTVTPGDSTDVSPSLDKSPPDPQKLIPTPPTHTHEARARGTAWPCPEAVDPNHWRDFLAARKRKNLVNTETARLGVLRDIEKHTDTDWPPGRLVEHAAAKGWGSINKPDGYQNGRATTNGMGGHRGHSASGHGSTVDAAQRFLARHTA